MNQNDIRDETKKGFSVLMFTCIVIYYYYFFYCKF